MTARTDLDQTMRAYFEAGSSNHAPDGLLEGALFGVGRMPQRPAWRTLDWWLPSASVDRVAWHTRRVGLVAAVALLIAVLVGLAVLSGSGHRLPPPFGPARPGAIVMEIGADLYLADADGRNRTKLYAGPHWDGHATFSPDGTKIAFESVLDDKSKALLVMNADGTGLKTLISSLWHVDDVIDWSSDSRWVTTSARPNADSGPNFPYSDDRILVGDVERGSASFVGGSGLTGHDPRWSPDGAEIAFGRTEDCCGFSPGSLWVMRPDGSDLRQVSSLPGGGQPAWSPDGKRIAFLGTGVAGDSDLFLIDADGKDQQRITNDPGDESYPAWSPDGTKIAFPRMLNQYGAYAELEILDATSGRVSSLQGAFVTYDPPIWSPDGRHILGFVYRNGEAGGAASEYDDLAIFDATKHAEPVDVAIPGLRTASWQRLAP